MMNANCKQKRRLLYAVVEIFFIQLFLLATACSESPSESTPIVVRGGIDTVYSLDAPRVTAKAYPGVTVVSWEPVTGASDYKVSVYEEGIYKETKTLSSYSFTNTNLVNGKNYTYYVEAMSTTNPGTITMDTRAVYAKNSRGEASARAIVPPAGTKSLELPAYEDGYDGTNTKTVSDDNQWVIKKDNIKVVQDNEKISVSFPMKAYLGYTVKCYNNDLLHDENVNNGAHADSMWDINSNNAVGLTSFDITDAGEYEIAIIAKAFDSRYADSEEVISSTHVKIGKLDLDSDTSGAQAYYLSESNKFVANADKTVRVEFTPAKKSGDYVSTSWYKVYRRVKGEYKNTQLTAAIEESVNHTDGANVTKYYVDDTVADVTCDYVYTIVVTDGNYYGKSAEVNLGHASMKPINGITLSNGVASTDADGKTKYTWTVTTTTEVPTSATLTAYILAVQDNDSRWGDTHEALSQDIIEKGIRQTPKLMDSESPTDPKSYKVEIGKSDISITGERAKVYLLVQATLSGYAPTNIINSDTVVTKK